MFIAHVSIENFRCFGEGASRFELPLRRGLTALVGENDAGKSAVIDALRLALGTTDQEWNRIDDGDFNVLASSRDVRIVCRFEDLDSAEKSALMEYLTYSESGGGPIFYLNWIAKDAQDGSAKASSYRRVEVHSGKNGDGPLIAQEVREMLRATYLRPLRDAAQAMSAGRGSRLSQVLHYTPDVRSVGRHFDPAGSVDPKELNVLGIGDLANSLLANQPGIVDTRTKINENLEQLALSGEKMASTIRVSGATAAPDRRLRQLLEKLDLVLGVSGEQGKLGLGSNNLLFIACELLLLSQEVESSRLLLIEEPEAHLHPQRQLRVMKFLQAQAEEKKIQVIVTTHSPNLASAIRLDNLVIVKNGHAYSLAQESTALQLSDYRFLQRFLDVTKANLFFAKGVLVVEGDAENILFPTLASLLNRDLTENGVSIVNVGGVGLSRYARIFQRKAPSQDGEVGIRVACVTDMDVMPDCAPLLLAKIKEGDSWPSLAKRRWRAKKDIGNSEAVEAFRAEKRTRTSGQGVRTFVSDEWTLEYDLAFGRNNEAGTPSLADDVYIAASLAADDQAISTLKKTVEEVSQNAINTFAELAEQAEAQADCSAREVLAVKVYERFASGDASKAVAAQYLSERLVAKFSNGELNAETLRTRLPKYITDAIDYVTGAAGATEGGAS